MGYLRQLPIRVQLSMLLTLIIAIVIIINITDYSKAAKVVEKKNSEYFSETISQMNQTLISNTDVVKRKRKRYDSVRELWQYGFLQTVYRY